MAKEDEEEDEEMDEEEEIMKSLPQPVREMLEKAANEANYAKEELRKEREARRDEEFVQKAAAWQHLTVDAKDLGPALRRLTDIDANLASQVEKALSAANAQSESAAIFDEIGRGSRPDDGSAYAKVESMAKAAVNNGDFKTMEQAVASIVTQNPDLYAAYRAEQR
jgi:dsDNA-specific endonuclease/ATPase MutS2